MAISMLHTGVMGCLVVMAGVALYLTSRGQKIPMIIQLMFAVGSMLVLAAAMQVFGLIGAPPVDESKENAEYFEKKKERKDRKKEKKEALEKEKALQEVAALKKKAAAKAEKLAAAKAEKAAAVAAAAAAAAKKAEEERKAAPKEEKKAKKKKKKKTKAQAAKAAVVETTAEPEPEEEEEEEQGWIEVEDKMAIRIAKKAALGGAKPRVDGEMMVNERHYSSIIGPGGSVVAQIKDTFGVDVKFPRKGGEDQTVRFNGTESGIASTKLVINELIDKGYSKTLNGHLSDCVIEVGNLGLLIGPSGANIKAIQGETGTRITLPDKSKPDDKKVTIVGDSADVVRAQAAINMLMSEGYCDITHPNYTKSETHFPQSMIGVLKGPKGETIRRIQSSTKTKIEVPDKQEGVTLVAIQVLGPADGVKAAIDEIRTIQRDHLTREVAFPSNLIGILMGARDGNPPIIRTMQTNTNTRIDVEKHIWDPSLRTITISGLAKDIANVESQLAVFIGAHSVWRMDFPADRMGSLVGKGGESVRALEKKTGCRINISEHDWDDLVKDVTIIGPTEGVGDAKAALEKLATPPPKKEKAPEAAAASSADAAE